MRNLLRNGWARIEEEILPAASKGMATWSFLQIITMDPALAPRQSYSIRRSLRALEDVGLVKIKLGPRGGMGTAKVTWTPLAYLPKKTMKLVATNHDDDLALEALAAGLA